MKLQQLLTASAVSGLLGLASAEPVPVSRLQARDTQFARRDEPGVNFVEGVYTEWQPGYLSEQLLPGSNIMCVCC